ncbi:MAG: hypothetical protein AAF557_23620 [Pseudomonadota bacterium]
MASLDRAYGYRGATIALGMAMIAGGVQGIIAHEFDFLLVKVLVGLASALVLIMAGAISARQQFYSAIGLGLLMGVGFFLTRWGTWSLMDGGAFGALKFFSIPPWGWPAYLDQLGVSGFWIFEAVSMFCPALVGCYVGQERPEAESA